MEIGPTVKEISEELAEKNYRRGGDVLYSTKSDRLAAVISLPIASKSFNYLPFQFAKESDGYSRKEVPILHREEGLSSISRNPDGGPPSFRSQSDSMTSKTLGKVQDSVLRL